MFYRGQTPEYRIVQDPAEGHPEFLVAEINLPKVVSQLVVGEVTVNSREISIVRKCKNLFSKLYWFFIHTQFG